MNFNTDERLRVSAAKLRGRTAIDQGTTRAGPIIGHLPKHLLFLTLCLLIQLFLFY